MKYILNIQSCLWSVLMIGMLLLSGSCKKESGEKQEDRLLAEVFSKRLYLSELEGMVPPNKSPQDSTLIVNAFVERWVREQLLMQEAELKIPEELNIDDLVRDYRASLIRNNYEKILVEIQLDSVVTPEEILRYYNENKEQFKLNDKILRCNFIKARKDQTDFGQLRKWWAANTDEDKEAMLMYCNEACEIYMLEDAKWYKPDKITRHIPKSIFKPRNLESGFQEVNSDDQYYYFIKIFEVIEKNKLAPLAYASDQIIKVILHKRKIELLDRKKEELYDMESRRNNIKIYTQ